MELSKELIADLKNGCTVYGYKEAGEIRKLQEEHPDWIKVIDNMDELANIVLGPGKKFSGNDDPYFGAILTAKGKEALC